jgi:HPt (histidine-containing phosphotransfer) domain-containing protein
LSAFGKGSYDLILMDVQMPEMDGFEATAAIRRQEREGGKLIQIIAMTAHAMKGDRERCLGAGMNDYVSKPVSAQALVEVLEKWLPKQSAECGIGESREGKEEDEGGRGYSSLFAPRSSPTVWDHAVMLERVLGDEELARRILERFRADIPRQIQVLKEFLEAGDASSVEREAHTIKGVAANVGGEALRAVAFEMEKASRAGDLDAVKARMAELESQFERLNQAITPENWDQEARER